MKLYVCYGIGKPAPPGRTSLRCGSSGVGRRRAPAQVIRSDGLGMLPEALNFTSARREVKRLTGNKWVPVLLTDGCDVVPDSRIADWAQAHPA